MPTFPFRGQRETRPAGAGSPADARPQSTAGVADPVLLYDDESLVEVRCSVVVMRGQDVLLLHRPRPSERPPGSGSSPSTTVSTTVSTAAPDWVLPGGRPRAGEGMQACAGRELAEETGVRLIPQRCAFVTDVTDPATHRRRVEILFTARVPPRYDEPLVSEGSAEPTWVPVDKVRTLRLRPPIAGYLPALVNERAPTIPYLGNLWRPDEAPA